MMVVTAGENAVCASETINHTATSLRASDHWHKSALLPAQSLSTTMLSRECDERNSEVLFRANLSRILFTFQMNFPLFHE
jgi:hypothetical protein